MASAGMREYSLQLGWDINKCRSSVYLSRILDLEQPKFKTLSLKIRYSEKIFYPISDVEQVLSAEGVLHDIVSCQECEGCKAFPGFRGHRLEENMLINSITNEESPRYILLAILICMGQSYLIRYLKDDKISDNKLDNMTNNSVIPRGELSSLLPRKLSVDEFLDRFLMLKRRFDLKSFYPFSTGRRLEFDEDDIFPFTTDEEHSDSTFGTVRKFQIYPCYNYIYKNGVKVETFARKVLKASITEEDFRYERDNLAFVNSLANPNIIEMFTWYTTNKGQDKKEFTYLFPFMEASLKDVLMGKENVPEHLKFQQSASLYSSQIWQQMIDITSALAAIHNPNSNALILSGLQPAQGGWVGYHFDIKPSNILVDAKGKFLITDFGLSVFKGRGSDDPANPDETQIYGQAGTPAYQPPGLPPHPGILPPGDPQYDIPRMRRTYDVWSLACVMTEVITFVLGYNGYKGHEAVASFANRRASDSTFDGSTAWHYRSNTANHEPRLKASVDDWFNYMRKIATADPDVQGPYLTNVLDLLLEMFGIHSRSSSADVERRLRDANRREKERMDNLLRPTTAAAEEPTFSVEKWIRARGTESLIYDSENPQQAECRIFVRDYFIDQSPDNASAMTVKVKPGKWIKLHALKVFKSSHSEPRIRVVMVLREQGKLVAESESSVWKYEQLIPLYRYNGLSPEFAHSCAFRRLFVDRIITFESPPDLHEFQKTLLGYRRKADFSLSLSHCSTDQDKPLNLPLSSKNGSIVEIWTTHGVRDRNNADRPMSPYDAKGLRNGLLSPKYPGSISSRGREGSIYGPPAGREEKKQDSVVIIFRSLQQDILIIPILQQRAQICGGRPQNYNDQDYASFVPNTKQKKFTILCLGAKIIGGRLDPMDPISGIPGLPLDLQSEIERTQTDVDKITTINRRFISFGFENTTKRTEFIKHFYAAFSSKLLFESAFLQNLVQDGILDI